MWKALKEARGSPSERERGKDLKRAGRNLRRIQREGVNSFLDEHARSLENRRPELSRCSPLRPRLDDPRVELAAQKIREYDAC